jgi:hypothetical protein
MAGQVGVLFEDIPQEIAVFFLGDHDPSGHVIEEDIHRRAETASGKSFRMLRLAIHKEDIAAFNPGCHFRQPAFLFRRGKCAPRKRAARRMLSFSFRMLARPVTQLTKGTDRKETR